MEVRRALPPEAESSLAFEAPAEEPNFTLVTDSFLLSRTVGGVWGGAKFAAWGAYPPQDLPLSSPLAHTHRSFFIVSHYTVQNVHHIDPFLQIKYIESSSLTARPH